MLGGPFEDVRIVQSAEHGTQIVARDAKGALVGGKLDLAGDRCSIKWVTLLKQVGEALAIVPLRSGRFIIVTHDGTHVLKGEVDLNDVYRDGAWSEVGTFAPTALGAAVTSKGDLLLAVLGEGAGVRYRLCPQPGAGNHRDWADIGGPVTSRLAVVQRPDGSTWIAGLDAHDHVCAFPIIGVDVGTNDPLAKWHDLGPVSEPAEET
jgi:hypothetical protein